MKHKILILDYFSKIRLTDKIITLLFLIIIAISTFFFLRKSEYIYITMSLIYNPNYLYDKVEMPTPWFIDKLKPGIEEKDFFGKEQIKIENIYRYDMYHYEGVIECYVTLKIKSVYDKKNQKYTFDGLPLSIGDYAKFTIQDFQLNGIIQSISKTIPKLQKEKYLVKGFLDSKNNREPLEHFNANISTTDFFTTDLFSTNGVSKNITNKMTTNDKIIDSDGYTIADIKKIIKSPAEYKILSNNEIIYIPDIDREKIELELEIDATIINSEPYYKLKRPLKINSLIDLNFKNFQLFMTITDVQPIIKDIQ